MDRSLPIFGLNLIQSGRGFFRSDRSSECRLQKGDMFLLSPRVHHVYGPGDGEWEEYWLYFDGALAQTFAENHGGEGRSEVSALGHEAAALFDDFENVLMALDQPVPELSVDLCGLVYRCLSLFAMHARRESTSVIKSLAMELEADPMRDWDFKLLAEERDISYSSLRQRFSKEMGRSLGAYLRLQRMQLAAQHLMKGRSSQEVTRMVGMDDPHHFSRMFKAVMGSSPRQWVESWRSGFM